MTGTTGHLSDNPSKVVGQSRTLIFACHMELGRVKGLELFTKINY
jgi:hypothetical protein